MEIRKNDWGGMHNATNSYDAYENYAGDMTPPGLPRLLTNHSFTS